MSPHFPLLGEEGKNPPHSVFLDFWGNSELLFPCGWNPHLYSRSPKVTSEFPEMTDTYCFPSTA
jgi:hypothetical protein